MSSVMNHLTQAARQAYGSRFYEKTSGGRGHIGMFNGRVIKFDTHGDEGGDAVAMKTACDALRKSILDDAQKALGNTAGAQKALAEIRAKLGMNEKGEIVDQGLLKRKVVASIITTIEQNSDLKVWDEMKAKNGAVNTRKRDTSFKTVSAESEKLWGNLKNQVCLPNTKVAFRQLKLCGNIEAMLKHVGALPDVQGGPSDAEVKQTAALLKRLGEKVPRSVEGVETYFEPKSVNDTVRELRAAAQKFPAGEMKDSLNRLAEMMAFSDPVVLMAAEAEEGLRELLQPESGDEARQNGDNHLTALKQLIHPTVDRSGEIPVKTDYDFTGIEKLRFHAPTHNKTAWDEEPKVAPTGYKDLDEVGDLDDDDGFEVEKSDNDVPTTKAFCLEQSGKTAAAGNDARDVAEKLVSDLAEHDAGLPKDKKTDDMTRMAVDRLARSVRTTQALVKTLGDRLIAQGDFEGARKLFERADYMYGLLAQASKDPRWDVSKDIHTVADKLDDLFTTFNLLYGQHALKDALVGFAETKAGKDLLASMPGVGGHGALSEYLPNAIDTDNENLRLECFEPGRTCTVDAMFDDETAFYTEGSISPLRDGEELACKLMKTGDSKNSGILPEDPAKRAFAIRFGAAYNAYLLETGLPPSLFNTREPFTAGEEPARVPTGPLVNFLAKAGCDIPPAYVTGEFAVKLSQLLRTGKFDGMDAENIRKIVADTIAETQFVSPEEFAILTAKIEGPSKVSFEIPPAKPEGVQKLAADLLCPADIGLTVISPTGDATQAGGRLHGVIKEHKNALVQIFNELRKVPVQGGLGPAGATRADIEKCPSLAGLEEDERAVVAQFVMQMRFQHNALMNCEDNVAAVLDELYGLDTGAAEITDGQQTNLTKLEASLGDIAQGVCEKIQEKVIAGVNRLFPKTDAKPFDDSGNSLADILASGEDMDLKFLKTALEKYFEKLGPNDARLLLATKTRNRDPNVKIPEGEEGENARFSAILKSAGPILLKMLQGLDTSNFGTGAEKLKDILADVKDNLYAIPQEQVRAFLDDRIAASKGDITAITVKRSLGAASVGQTFLCEVVYEGGRKEMCAIKVLRTESGLRAEREKKVLGEIAQGMGDAMAATFRGKADRIMEEFDFSTENANIGTGREAYGSGKTGIENVDSVEGLPGLKPTSHVLGMKAVPGKTYKRRLEEIDKEIAATDDPAKLAELREEAVKNHRALENLAQLWFQRAVFTEGTGVYHGDLHSGNVMVDGGKATMIDFGNVTNLSPKEVNAFLHVIAGAASGLSIGKMLGFEKGFCELLSPKAKKQYEERLARDEIEKKHNPGYRTLHDRIMHILSLGTGQDVGLRVSCLLKLLRTEGFEVPQAIYNFNESQIRLGEVLATSKKTIEAIDGKLDGLGTKPEDANPKTIIDCVGNVVQNNVDFTIKQVGMFNGMLFAAGFKTNGLLTKDQLMGIVKSGIVGS